MSNLAEAMQFCNGCSQSLPSHRFSRNTAKCKECRSKARKVYYAEHKEESREYGIRKRAEKRSGKPAVFRGKQAQDFYQTPAAFMQELLDVEDFDHNVWDPCCGEGAMGRVLRAAGHTVRESDLVQRIEGPEQGDFLHNVDWFDGDIIMGPPFTYLTEFVSLGMVLTKRKLAVIMPMTALGGKGRQEKLWSKFQCSKIICSPRFQEVGIEGVAKIQGFYHMWAVFDKQHVGEPQILWTKNEVFRFEPE